MQIGDIKQGIPSWVELMTTDDEAAVAFYGELFGWEDDAQEIPGGGVYHMAKLSGDQVAGLGKQNAEEVQRGIPPHWSVYLAVDDAEATAAKVDGAGGQVLVPVMDVMGLGRMAVIADPTGGTVGLWQAQLHKGFDRRDEPGTISWCELITDDPARAAEFFRTVLDVPTAEMPMGTDNPYTLLGPDGEQGAGIMKKTSEMGAMPNVWGVYFDVADADMTVAKARSLGATILQEPMDIMPGRFAMLADPRGAVFGVIKSNQPSA